MSSPFSSVKRVLGRGVQSVRRNVRDARRGSILILVVALLVLVAIIGTAALSTNTIDRYATGQNNANTQIDLLMEGVKNMAKSVVAGDLYGLDVTGANQFRPESSVTYEHWDMPLLVDPNNRPTGMRAQVFEALKQANDAWLSPRYPDLLDPHPNSIPGAPPATPFDPENFAANPPVWDAIGAPIENPNGVPTVGQLLFDTPGVFNSAGVLQTTVARGYNYRITDRRTLQDDATGNNVVPNPLIPQSIAYQTSTGTFTAPAWLFDGNFYIAADADGDGIADSGLKRINVGEINGLTYYYAVRIIDNGSQINVNTAYSRDKEFLGDDGSGDGTLAMGSRAGTPVPLTTNFFPSSIGLAEMLRTNVGTAVSINQFRTNGGTLNEIGGIDSYRFNNVNPTLIPTGIQTDQATGFATPNNQVFVDDPDTGSITTHTDFAFNTVGEMLWFQLGRRVGNPGLVDTDTRFKPFSVSDSSALAYRFVMSNLNASKSPLESVTSLATNPANTTPPTGTAHNSLTLDSLYWMAPNRLPEPPGAVRPRTGAANAVLGSSAYNLNRPGAGQPPIGLGYWFNENFAWDSEFQNSGGSVSFWTEVPSLYRSRRTMITADNSLSNTLPLPPGVTGLGARKASVNTSAYMELFNAFFGVMSEGGAESPYRAAGSTMQPPNPLPAEFYLYTGMRFLQPPPTWSSPFSTDPDNTQSPVSFLPQQGGDTHMDRMFRSPIRDWMNVGDPTSKYDERTNRISPVSDTSASTHMLPQHVRLLRAYLAAGNTVSMRHPSRSYFINPEFTKAAANPSNPLMVQVNNAPEPADVIVYPAEAQPFITEVYVNTDTNRNASDYDPLDTAIAAYGKNDEPYVAIELFYPYPIDPNFNIANFPAGTGAPWDMRPVTGATPYTGWQLRVISRDPSAPRNNGRISSSLLGTITATDAFFDPPTTSDPRYGSYIILENFNENASDYSAEKVRYRPRSSGLPYRGSLAAFHNVSPADRPPVKSVYVPDLALLIKRGRAATTVGGELLIERPITPTAANFPNRPIDSFDFSGIENQSLPGSPNNTAGNMAFTIHYARQGKLAGIPTSDPNSGEWWSFIYPGRYNGGINADPSTFIARRQQGVQAGRWNNTPVADPNDPTNANWPQAPGNFDPFDPKLHTSRPVLDPKVTLGGEYNELTQANDTPGDNASFKATYPNTFKTQLLNYDQPGWNPIGWYITGTLGTVPPNKFPYGAFARNSDILQIPYFAAYRIKPATPAGAPPSTEDFEVNTMSMDLAFCEDTDVYDDETSTSSSSVTYSAFEQVGRFAPVSMPSLPPTAIGGYVVDDLDPAPERTYRYGTPDAPDPDPNTGVPKNTWRYRWATRIFDYLTVMNPETDYLPNVAPQDYQDKMGGNRPVPVSNEGGTAGDPYNTSLARATIENGVAIQGLININTASWRVLSSINWTPFPSGTPERDKFSLVTRVDGEYDMTPTANGVDDNIELAKAIVWWRDGKDGVTTIPVAGDGTGGPIGPKGPFRSVFDLYRVMAIRNYYFQLSVPPNDLGDRDDADGDYSPANNNPQTQGTATNPIPMFDEVRYDYEERFQLMGRVSNLITTRSDSFTVYIVVQGWRNVDSTNPNLRPEMVVQRRAAFIADRSSMTANGGQLKITNVATE